MSIYDSKLKLVLWIVFLCSTGSLFVGKILQYVYHLKPCPLCLYQQSVLLSVVLTSAVLIFLMRRHKTFSSYFLMLVPLLLFINLVLALYHVGVEHHIFKLPSQCHGNLGQHSGDIDSLRSMLLETDVVPCDKVKWSFLGISMAGYNVLFSFFLLGLWAWAWLVKPEEIKK